MITRFARMTAKTRSNLPFAYAWAFLLICLAFFARLLAGPLLNGFPFLTFFPAVALAAFLCGTGPAVITAIVGAAMAVFFVMEQNAGYEISLAGVLIAYLFYFATTGLIIALVDALLDALDRERAAREELSQQKNQTPATPVSRW